MQTPKTRTGSSEVPQRTSPVTPRTAKQSKTPTSDSDSSNRASRTPKDRSPKVVEHRSPRSPVTEKKRPGKVSDLESLLAQHRDELKKAKNQLSAFESLNEGAQQEAKEAKKELAAMSAKLEESHKQLVELSASEEARIQELYKISQERDKAWQSELDAIKQQHSMDLQNLRLELTETLSLVEKLNTQLRDCKESEDRALELVGETQMELNMAMKVEETLRAEGLKAMEAYKFVAMELEQSKTRRNGEDKDSDQLKADLNEVKSEVDQLKSVLDASERRYQEENIHSTLLIRSAYEQVELTKSELALREAEMSSELGRAKAEIEELKAKIMANETKLQSLCEENEGLNLKMEKDQYGERDFKFELESKLEMAKAEMEVLKSNIMAKEFKLQSISEENERLNLKMEKDQSGEMDVKFEMELKKLENELENKTKENEMLMMEMKKREMESKRENDEALGLAESVRASEREALMKVGYLTEEADKSNRKAARIIEQLDAVQASNSEMEAELRRLKVQSDQWRKAAEAAAAMLSSGNNGKFVERTGSLDKNYNTIGAKLGSPFSEDMDDESPKKKNGNMLKKIGILLKKGQK